jgi:hypothetical protein
MVGMHRGGWNLGWEKVGRTALVSSTRGGAGFKREGARRGSMLHGTTGEARALGGVYS